MPDFQLGLTNEDPSRDQRKRGQSEWYNKRPISSLKGHLGLPGSLDQKSQVLFWRSPCLSGESAPSLHPSRPKGGNSPDIAISCGLPTRCIYCVNCPFIKHALNYPNLSAPSVSSWDFDRYTLTEAIYQAIIGYKHPTIN